MRTLRLVEKSLQPGCHEIQVEGEVDLAVADQLRETLERAAEHDQILVGLERCEFIDSTAIAVLVHAHTQMAAQGKRVVVYGATSQVERILSITGLTQNGMVFENLDDALAAPEQLSPGTAS
jgi:anti-sigma B factor antagonist